MPARRAALRTSNMCGTHALASATPFRRSHTFPPSEIKSLYGSITTRPVMSFSYVTSAMLSYGTDPEAGLSGNDESHCCVGDLATDWKSRLHRNSGLGR